MVDRRSRLSDVLFGDDHRGPCAELVLGGAGADCPHAAHAARTLSCARHRRRHGGGGGVPVAVNLGMTVLKGGKYDVAEEASALPEGAEGVSVRSHSKIQQSSQERLSLSVLLVAGLALFGLTTFMVVGMGAMFGGAAPSSRAHELSAQEVR